MVWIESGVLIFAPSRRYAHWHDRAVFHCLTSPWEREKYIEMMRRAPGPEGRLVLATFGPDGPRRCGGLDIQHNATGELRQLPGDRFTLRDDDLDVHRTPAGSSRQFLYSR